MTPEKENPRAVVILAEDTEPGAGGAAGLPARVARYSKARLRALESQAYCQDQGHVKEAKRLQDCGNYLVFRHYYTVDQVRLHGASFCKLHLLCPLCAIRRGSKMLQAYLERMEAAKVDAPALRPYLVTLTVKNGEDLAERVRHLRAGLRKMGQARRDWKAGSGPFVQFAHSYGGFHSIEVTNKGQGWHPHAHMIWMCALPPSQEALSAEWQAWTGDSFIVDVRPLHDPVEGFLEVCKYALKFSDLSMADNWEAYRVLKGARLIDAHGLFRGVMVPEALTDVPLDDLPYIELFYRYLIGAGYSLIEARSSPSFSASHSGLSTHARATADRLCR